MKVPATATAASEINPAARSSPKTQPTQAAAARVEAALPRPVSTLAGLQTAAESAPTVQRLSQFQRSATAGPRGALSCLGMAATAGQIEQQLGSRAVDGTAQPKRGTVSVATRLSGQVTGNRAGGPVIQPKWTDRIDLIHKNYNLQKWIQTENDEGIERRQNGWYRAYDDYTRHGDRLVPGYQAELLRRSNSGEDIRFGYSRTLLEYVISFLESKDLLSLRLASRLLNRKALVEAERRVPYPDFTIFALLNQVMFPDVFAKGNFTDAPMNKRDNLQFAWLQYTETMEGQQNLALVGRIFQTETFLRLQSMERAESLQQNQVIFRPATKSKWSPQIDDSWVLGHIHKRSQILLMFDPLDKANIFDEKSQRLTATGREILIALQNGYKPFANNGEIEGVRGGVLLLPPARIQNEWGVQKSDLAEIDINSTFLPLVKAKEHDQTVGSKSFDKSVEENIGANIDGQINAGCKNFLKLKQNFQIWFPKLGKEEKLTSKAFKEKIKLLGSLFAVVDPYRVNFFLAHAQLVKTCVSLLTPDTYVVPTDRQDNFRRSFFIRLDEDSFLDFGKNASQLQIEIFKRIYSEILDKVDKKK